MIVLVGVITGAYHIWAHLNKEDEPVPFSKDGLVE
jgi:hypothetical protein